MNEDHYGSDRRAVYNRRLRVTLLGRRLLSQSIIDESTLRRALHVSRRSGRPLGQVLLEGGEISQSQLREALISQRKQRARCESKMLSAVEREALEELNSLADETGVPTEPPHSVSHGQTRIGALLRRAGLVTAHQRSTGRKLGRILLQAGEISRHALRVALRLQQRLRKLGIAAGICGVLAISPACNSYDYRGTQVHTTPWDAHWNKVERALERAHEMRYQNDEHGDHWQNPAQTQRRGGGDCEDLSIWLYARLIENGVHGARVCVGKKSPRDSQFHSWVVWLTGDKTYILDPTVSGSASDARLCPAGYYKPYYSYDVDGKYVHHRLSQASFRTGY